MATVNNAVYETLGDRWYHAADDPIALLRAQAKLHTPWIAERIATRLGAGPHRVLDLGCGGGLVANPLAERGLDVLGVDLAADALEVAARHQTTDRVRWLRADARALPLADASFDVVCALDFLEHVSPVGPVVAEVGRVLSPGGLFFFHTFERSWLSWLVVIKGVDWFVRNAPADLHVLEGFIKSKELEELCASSGLDLDELHGCEPRLSRAFFELLLTGVVPPELEFRFTGRPLTGYSGIATRRTRDARRATPTIGNRS